MGARPSEDCTVADGIVSTSSLIAIDAAFPMSGEMGGLVDWCSLLYLGFVNAFHFRTQVWTGA